MKEPFLTYIKIFIGSILTYTAFFFHNRPIRSPFKLKSGVVYKSAFSFVLFFLSFGFAFAGNYDDIFRGISCENDNATARYKAELLENTGESSYTWYLQFYKGIDGNGEILGMSIVSTTTNKVLPNGNYYMANPDGSYGWNPCSYGEINSTGDNYFIVLIPQRFGTGDTTTFMNYFQDRSASPPSENFAIRKINKKGLDIDTLLPLVSDPIASEILEIYSPEAGTTTPTNSVEFSFLFYNAFDGLQVNKWNLRLYDKVNANFYTYDFDLPAGEFGIASETVTIANNSTYEATLFLYNSNTPDLIRSVTSVSFNVVVDPLSYLGIEDFDNLGGLATSTCSISNITGCLQNALLFMFYPSKNVLDKYKDLQKDFEKKPPFGYITVYSDQLAELSSSGEGAYSLASESNINTIIFSPLRSGLSKIIWVCFGFWIFNRIRKQEL